MIPYSGTEDQFDLWDLEDRKIQCETKTGNQFDILVGLPGPDSDGQIYVRWEPNRTFLVYELMAPMSELMDLLFYHLGRDGIVRIAADAVDLMRKKA